MQNRTPFFWPSTLPHFAATGFRAWCHKCQMHLLTPCWARCHIPLGYGTGTSQEKNLKPLLTPRGSEGRSGRATNDATGRLTLLLGAKLRRDGMTADLSFAAVMTARSSKGGSCRQTEIVTFLGLTRMALPRRFTPRGNGIFTIQTMRFFAAHRLLWQH